MAVDDQIHLARRQAAQVITEASAGDGDHRRVAATPQAAPGLMIRAQAHLIAPVNLATFASGAADREIRLRQPLLDRLWPCS